MTRFPLVGAFSGTRHPPTPPLRMHGVSQHPLQRIGGTSGIAATTLPVWGSASPPGLHTAPPTAGPYLLTPPTLHLGLLAHTRIA